MEVVVKAAAPQHNCLQLTADLEAIVERVWTERQTANVVLFNALKFRLAGSHVSNGVLTLRLGLTDYRHHLASLDPAWHAAVPMNAADVWPNALGCNCVLVTACGHVVLMQRSEQTAEFAGAVALPGGHAEPAAMNIDASTDWASVDMQRLRDHLFDSMVEETVDELGIGRDALSAPHCLGIVVRRDRRCVMSFTLTTPMTFDELNAVYKQGKAVDQFESKHLVAMPMAGPLPDGIIPDCTRLALDLFWAK